MTAPYQSSSSPIVVHYGTPRSDRFRFDLALSKTSYEPKKSETSSLRDRLLFLFLLKRTGIVKKGLNTFKKQSTTSKSQVNVYFKRVSLLRRYLSLAKKLGGSMTGVS